MRNRLLSGVLLFALLAAPSVVIGQEVKKADRKPDKGDTVIVVGCLRGSALESQETRLSEDESPPIAALITYRLTGDKKLLEELKDAHSRHLEEITGVLKSRLPDPRGTQIGKSGVYVGLKAPTPNPSQPTALPVLEVTSFKHLGTECGR